MTLVLAGVFAGGGGGRPASAHSDLLESRPAYGDTVAAPSEMNLTFNYRLDLSYWQFELTDDKGRLGLGKPIFSADRRSVRVPVAEAQPGPSRFTYWLVAEDTHTMGGEVAFTVKAGAGSDPAAGATPTGTARVQNGATPVRVMTRAAPLAGVEEALAGVDYGFLAVLAGGGTFLVLAWPAGVGVPRARRVLWWSLAGAATTSAGLMVVKGLSLAQLEGSIDGGGPSVASALTGSWFGRATLARLVCLALAVPLLVRLGRSRQEALASPLWRGAAVVLALAALATHGALGHAANSWSGRALGLIHLVAITVWIGGLVVLGLVVLPRRRGSELRSVVPRFSALALSAVSTMAITGVLLLVTIEPDWGRLLRTGYGQALLAKFTLVGLLLAAASLSRSFVQRRLLASSASGPVLLRPFVYSVGTEVALAACVLAATSILVNLPPPA